MKRTFYAVAVGTPAGILWWTGAGWGSLQHDAAIYQDFTAADAVRLDADQRRGDRYAPAYVQSIVNLAAFTE